MLDPSDIKPNEQDVNHVPFDVFVDIVEKMSEMADLTITEDTAHACTVTDA